MQHSYVVQLAPNVEVREDEQDILVAGPSGAALRLKHPGSAFRALLDNLAQFRFYSAWRTALERRRG